MPSRTKAEMGVLIRSATALTDPKRLSLALPQWGCLRLHRLQWMDPPNAASTPNFHVRVYIIRLDSIAPYYAAQQSSLATRLVPQISVNTYSFIHTSTASHLPSYLAPAKPRQHNPPPPLVLAHPPPSSTPTIDLAITSSSPCNPIHLHPSTTPKKCTTIPTQHHQQRRPSRIRTHLSH